MLVMNGNNLRCVLGVSICVLVFSHTRPAGAVIVPGDFDIDCDVDSADFERPTLARVDSALAQCTHAWPFSRGLS
jgi:hypothetical protein